MLPNELCLRVGCERERRNSKAWLISNTQILSFVEHPKTLARSCQVSRRWHELISDDMAWKALCETHAYQRMSGDSDADSKIARVSSHFNIAHAQALLHAPLMRHSSQNLPSGSGSSSQIPSETFDTSLEPYSDFSSASNRAKRMSYRSHFKRRYMVETAWRTGGRMQSRQITPDHGVVTSLHLTDKYIVVALDNAKVHVFDASGMHQKTLHGHMMGVWAMVPWGDILVSGGCDRDVRVWNMATGYVAR